MKRYTPILVLVLLLFPALLFAQSWQNRERGTLQRLGLTESQVTQVLDVQAKMQNTIYQSRVRLRLVRAQIADALLPANPDMQKVNALVDQEARVRADMEKSLIADRLKIRAIVGEQNYRRLTELGRARFRAGRPGAEGRGRMDGSPWYGGGAGGQPGARPLPGNR